jgi:hypothetical protein
MVWWPFFTDRSLGHSSTHYSLCMVLSQLNKNIFAMTLFLGGVPYLKTALHFCPPSFPHLLMKTHLCYLTRQRGSGAFFLMLESTKDE